MTLHLTNLASRRLHRGRVHVMMAYPPRWFTGPLVPVLAPLGMDLRQLRAGTLPLAEYEARYRARLATADLRPGGLLTAGYALVVDGDTLCCTCSRDEAAAGRCHRVWAADVLAQHGWTIMLDGALRTPPENFTPSR